MDVQSLGIAFLIVVAVSCGGRAPGGGIDGGPPAAGPPTGAGTASLSSVATPPARAVDGDLATRWTTGAPQASGQWFQVDLEPPRVVTGIVMDSGGSAEDYARAFEVFAFDDPASPGTPVASGTGDGAVVSVTFKPQAAKHVRVALKGNARAAWSIHELVVNGTASPSECTAAIVPRATLTGHEQEVQYQADLLKYCTGAGIANCEQTVRSRMNVDFFMAAAQLYTERMSTARHIAVLRDREAKLRAFRKDPAAACEVAAHDGDGDYVPDRTDACPDTPPLTPVLADGCTNTLLPAGPDIQGVNRQIARLALTFDPRCKNNEPPPTPNPLGVSRLSWDPSVGKAIWLSRAPGATGCPLYYEVEFTLSDGVLRSTVFKDTEDVPLPWTARPDGAVQFNIHVQDGGDRGAWAQYGSYTRTFRARAFNLAGQRSDWSEAVSPAYADCVAGQPTGDGIQ